MFQIVGDFLLKFLSAGKCLDIIARAVIPCQVFTNICNLKCSASTNLISAGINGAASQVSAVSIVLSRLGRPVDVNDNLGSVVVTDGLLRINPAMLYTRGKLLHIAQPVPEAARNEHFFAFEERSHTIE
ncbi:hypothetical protein D3C81_1743410 [compost metagenome]